MELRLGCACADGAEGHQIREELRGDGVEHLGSDGHARGREVAGQLSADSESLVDPVGHVDVRVVDETFPSHRCAQILEVGAHDDAEVVGELLGEGLQLVAVFECGGGVVDGAGVADDEEAVGAAHDDFDGILVAFEDGVEGGLRGWDSEGAVGVGSRDLHLGLGRTDVSAGLSGRAVSGGAYFECSPIGIVRPWSQSEAS